MIFERPISKSEVPGYNELVYDMDFNWTETHLKRGQIKRRIREYREKLSSLHKLDPANADVRENAIADLLILREAISKKVAIFLHNNRRAANPFSARLDRLNEFIPAIFITEEMIDRAVELMPVNDDCISLEQKQKEKAKLEKLIEKKKSELEKVSPPDHFLWVNGQPTMDLCEKFEKKWRSTQARLNAPCSILGHELSTCKPTEQQAWRQLGIRSAMNPKSRFSPLPRK